MSSGPAARATSVRPSPPPTRSSRKPSSASSASSAASDGGDAPAPADVTYEPVIGIEIHVELKTRLQDVLRLLERDRRGRAQRADLPGLPGPARSAAGHQPRSRASRARGGRRDRRHARRRSLAGTARTTSIRTCPRATRSASTSCRSPAHGSLDRGDVARPRRGRHHPRPPRGGHGPAAAHARDGDRPVSLLDYDRSGVPLLEIVTDPVIHDAETARRYAEELRLLLVTIGASDAAMESGQMRVEANVSLRPRRHRALRHARGGQEHELVPLGGARHRVRDRPPGGCLAVRRAAHPGDPWLGRRPRRDLPHAHQGDLGRLPLLSRAGPAAAAGGPRLAGGDRRGPARAAGRTPCALPRGAGPLGLRRRRARGRRRGDGGLRGRPGRRPRPARQEAGQLGQR